MKYLVLALCVCAASAASFGSYKPYQPQAAKSYTPYQPQQVAKATAQVVQAPIVAVTEIPTFVAKNIAPVAKTAYTGEAEAPIVRYDADVAADGFNFAYETGNGIAAQSSGSLKKVENADVLAISGSYQYTAPDGTPVRFAYTADEFGYHPESDLLPVGPPIPEAIARSLEYLRAHPPKPENY